MSMRTGPRSEEGDTVGSLTVHVMNHDGDPVRDKRVFVNFVGGYFGSDWRTGSSAPSE